MDVCQWHVLPRPGEPSGRRGKCLAEWKMAVCKQSVCTQLKLWQETVRDLLPLLPLPLPIIDLYFNSVNSVKSSTHDVVRTRHRPFHVYFESQKAWLAWKIFTIYCNTESTVYHAIELAIVPGSPCTRGLLIKHLCPWVASPCLTRGLLYCTVGLTNESTRITISSKLLSQANLNFTSLLTHNPVRTFFLYRVCAWGGLSSQAIGINYSD